MARMMTLFRGSGNTGDKAEQRVYDALRDHLSDEFIIFQHIPIHRPPRTGNAQSKGNISERGTEVDTARDREVDFLIIHPNYGILVLEVKDGKIVRDEKSGKLYSQSWDGVVHKDKTDILQQLKNEMYAIRNYLSRDNISTKSLILPKWFYRALWATDMPLAGFDAPDLSSICVLDKDSFLDVESAIKRFFESIPLKRPMTQAVIDAIQRALLPSPDNIPLQSQITANNDRLKWLTDEQAKRLPEIRSHTKAVIEGGAGTGKTILAYELAFRLASEGKDVLLLCFTPYQREWIRVTLEQPTEISVRLKIFDLYSLVTTIANEAGLKRKLPDLGQITSIAGQKNLISPLKDALSMLRKNSSTPVWQFDAILLDEGQDFTDQTMSELISNLRKKSSNNIAWIFYSPEQRLDLNQEIVWMNAFGEKSAYGIIKLDHNVRNTYAIHHLMQVVNQPENSRIALDDIDNDIELIEGAESSDDATKSAIEQVIHRLIEEGFAPESIVVISCRAGTNSSNNATRYRSWKCDAEFWPIKPDEIQKTGCVSFSTIRAAKGLESEVVVLVELDGIEHQTVKQRRKLLYTAISRAKFRLIIIGSKHQFITLVNGIE